eukprot:Opistho-2@35829
MATEASELPQHAGEHITVTTPDGDTASTYHAGDLITVTTPDGDTASIMSGVSSMGASDRSEKPLYQPSPLRGAGYGWGLGWRDQAGIPRQRMNVDDADKASIIDEKEGLENPSFAFLLKYHGALGVGERGTKARDSAVAIIDQLKAVKGRPVRLQVDINEIVILSSTSGVVAKYAVYSVATCTMSDDQTYVAFIGTEDGRACLSRHNSMSSDIGGESDATKMRTSSTEAFTIEKSAAIHTCHVFSNESGGSTVGVARALAVLFRAAYKNFVTRAKDRDVAVGYTGLHWAAKAGQENLVSMWLRAGADVNARSRGGYTPLHLAALHNHIPVIKMLLAAGGDPSALDHGGRSPKDLVPLVARQPQQRPNPSQKSLSANPPAAASASPSERRQPLVTIRSGTFDGGIKQTAIESVSPASNRPEEYQMRRMTTVASTSRLSDDVRARTASFAGKPSSPLSSPRSMSFLGGKKKSEWVAVARAQQVVKGTDSAPGTPVTARKGGDEHSPKGGDEQSPKGGDEQSPKGGDEQSPKGGDE